VLTFIMVLCATLAVGPAQQHFIEPRIDIDDRVPAAESRLRGAAGRIPHSPTAVFSFGLVALVVAFIPVLSWLAWVPALAALVGLSRALKSDRMSRRTAFNGMVMGVAAWIIAILVSVGSLGAGDAPVALAEGTAPTPTSTPEPTPEPVPTPAETPAEAAAPEPVASTPAPAAAPAAPTPAATFFQNCDAVRAAGAAPIYTGQPGYSRTLDRDGDGVGCES